VSAIPSGCACLPWKPSGSRKAGRRLGAQAAGKSAFSRQSRNVETASVMNGHHHAARPSEACGVSEAPATSSPCDGCIAGVPPPLAIDLKIAKLCRKLWLESAPNLPSLPEGSERFPPVLQAWTRPRLPFLPQPGLRFGRGNWARGHQSNRPPVTARIVFVTASGSCLAPAAERFDLPAPATAQPIPTKMPCLRHYAHQ
jgi:hypothetical protein